MPNPLAPYKHCHQADFQERLDRAESAAFEAQQAFQGFAYRMPREADFTVPEWREYNRLRADYLFKSEARDRAFLGKTMCETVYTIPPRRPAPAAGPQLVPPAAPSPRR